jgi:hypothetical protein
VRDAYKFFACEENLTTKAQGEFRSNEGIFALLVGVLLAPLAWAAQQQTLYTMVAWACQSGHAVVMHLVSIAALLLAALGALVAWRNWQRADRGQANDKDDDRGGSLSRSRFLAVLGLTSSAFFFLVIGAQWIATFVLHPCMY